MNGDVVQVRLDMPLGTAVRLGALMPRLDGESRERVKDQLWLAAVLIEQRKRFALAELEAFTERANRLLAALDPIDPPWLIWRKATEIDLQRTGASASMIDGATAIEVHGQLVGICDEYGSVVWALSPAAVARGTRIGPAELVERLNDAAVDVLEIRWPVAGRPTALDAAASVGAEAERWTTGGPCGTCGSTNTYGYGGNAGCRDRGAHDADS